MPTGDVHFSIHLVPSHLRLTYAPDGRSITCPVRISLYIVFSYNIYHLCFTCIDFYDLSAWSGCWFVVYIRSFIYKFVNVCLFDYTAVAGSGKVGPVNQVNHISWVAVVTPTDRPKSSRNRCVIELFFGVVCVVILPFDISVGVGAFVIGLSQISSFFLWTSNGNFSILLYYPQLCTFQIKYSNNETCCYVNFRWPRYKLVILILIVLNSTVTCSTYLQVKTYSNSNLPS